MGAIKFNVIKYVGLSSELESVQRERDGVTFSLGDFVTNGTKMRGHITRFTYSFSSGDIIVTTDWSGVGMNLDSLSHKAKLPCAHQIGDDVVLIFGAAGTISSCQVMKVHFSHTKVLYDVDVDVSDSDLRAHTRLYNVDAAFISAA